MRTLGETAVGDVVYMRVSGVYTPFRVLHKGAPGSNYDSSFNGGVILCLDYGAQPFVTQAVSDPGGAKCNYANSYMHRALHQIWLPRLDAAMQALIKEVRLPYRTDTDSSPYVVADGAQGLSAKVWLPSLKETVRTAVYETGLANAYVAEGALMDYWADLSVSGFTKWAYKSGGMDAGWATRTPNVGYENDSRERYFYRVRQDGVGIPGKDNQVAARPCLVMPAAMTLDRSNHLHLSGSAQVMVGGAWKEGAVSCKQNGAWREAGTVAARIGGVWKE